MLKEMFTYKDIDGESQTRTVYFNLTQFEMEAEMELEIIQERFQKFQDEVIGDDDTPVRELTGPEKRELLGMIKTIIRHAYGRREGKRMVKTEEVWDEFEQTGAFSAYLYYLFSEDGKRANDFMKGIWPQGLDRPEDIPAPDLKVVQDAEVTPDALDEAKDPNWHYLNFDRQRLLEMSDEDFEKVQKASVEGRNVPLPLIQIDGVRHSRKRAGGTTDE